MAGWSNESWSEVIGSCRSRGNKKPLEMRGRRARVDALALHKEEAAADELGHDGAV